MRISLGTYNYVNEIYKELSSIDEKYHLTNKKVVLFGENHYTYCLCKWMYSHNIKVYKIIDNDYRKWTGGYRDDYKVESPYKMKWEMDVFVIITTIRYTEEMLGLLREMDGFREEQVYCLQCDRNRNRLISFQSKEGMWWNPSFSEIQEKQYDMFRYFKDVCTRHHLRYYLWAGSLLGAVRHKGMVPWDNDIDIVMPVNDFLVLEKILLEDERYGIYSFWSMTENHKAYHDVIKMVDMNTKQTWNMNPLYLDGYLAIDIFLLCGMPDSPNEQDFLRRKLTAIEQLWMKQLAADYGTELYSWKDHKECLEQLKELMLEYPYDSSNYIGLVHLGFDTYITERKNYDHPVMMEFYQEDEPVMANYDWLLQEMYGNYMNYPPDEGRQPLLGQDICFRYLSDDNDCYIES